MMSQGTQRAQRRTQRAQSKVLIIPAIYDQINDFCNGFAKVVKSGKVGFVDLKAKEIIPCVYDRNEQIITGAVIYYVTNGGSEVIEITVAADESRLGFSEGLVCVIKNGKYGFINKNNEIIIPFQYDGADNFYDSIAIIKQKDKYGAINRIGKIIIPIEYDFMVWRMGTNFPDIYTWKNGRAFYMDKDQNEIK